MTNHCKLRPPATDHRPPATGYRARAVIALLFLLPVLCMAAGRMAVMAQDTAGCVESGELALEAVRLTPHMTLAGVVAAVVFAGSLITVLWWLLAVPPPVAAVAAHARGLYPRFGRLSCR